MSVTMPPMGLEIRNYFQKLLKKSPETPLLDRLEDLIESDPDASKKIESDSSGELALVSNILGLKDLTAADIMVPRADIVAAKFDTSLDEFINLFASNHFSQIPIYNNTLDDVVGIVRVRDFLPYVKNRDSFDIRTLLKEVIYVVPSIKLLELLVEIRESANHLALVVDEFGGVDGLVTLQDVASEIVGEIQQNNEIFPQVATKPDGSFVMDAKILVSECEEMLKVDLLQPFRKDRNSDDPDIETVGGLMMLMAERMPTRGEIFSHPAGVEFEIMDADPRRVRRVLVRKK
jgi:CBS domain containing-hemolysin-like protein